MGQSLMLSFDEIYILDLHGNSKKKEHSPDGSPDQNVFDIQQGVAIGIYVKHFESKQEYTTVHHAHLWGLRESKYHILNNNNISTTQWSVLAPQSPFYLFTPQGTNLKAEYERGWKITDIYSIYSSCLNTLHDQFAISFDKTSLEAMLQDAATKSISDDKFRDKYKVVDSRDWKLSKLRAGLTNTNMNELAGKIRECLYRPFDRRWIVLDDSVVGYARWETTKHFLSPKSLGLVTTRQTLETISFLPSRIPFGQHKIVDPYNRSYVFPLYLYPDTHEKGLFDTITSTTSIHGRSANLSQTFISDISSKIDMQFIQDGKGDLQKTFGPEDIFNYMYAVFYSPTYRARYAEFFKTDFPRLPLTSNASLFRVLCSLGIQLVTLHLMEKKFQNVPKFDISGNNTVGTVRLQKTRSKVESGLIKSNTLRECRRRYGTFT
jgi:predicted helicase